MRDLEVLLEQAFLAIEEVQEIGLLDALRVDYLGKKGRLTELLKQLANLSAADKPRVGQLVNIAKRDLAAKLEEKRVVLKEQFLAKKIADEAIDITLPGRNRQVGSLHPVTHIKRKINEYFRSLGFSLVDGPEIESEFYNFVALNIPEHHPARAMHDTFYFGDGQLLRTHTSPVQIRTLLKAELPVRLIAPGRVYRCDSDLTHTPMFHQVEGLWLDKSVNLGQLKGVLHDFFTHLFGRQLALRFRPSYFPFTEPSAEMDIECTQCSGKGCRTCKFTGWLEVGGCGMVHPNVLKSVNISADEYQGWAFGMGIDRLAMLYYGIDDLRMLFENDIMFLKQF